MQNHIQAQLFKHDSSIHNTDFYLEKPRFAKIIIRKIFLSKNVIKNQYYFKLAFGNSKCFMMLVFNYYLALISHLKGMQDSSKLSIVFFTIYQLLKKVPFHGLSTKILLLWHGFPLARFFSGQKTVLKEECLYYITSE